MRFVCAKPLDFVKLGLSSLATEHLTLRRSGGEGGGELGRTFSFAPRVVKRDPRNQAASAAACTKLFLSSVTRAKANKRRRSVRETATPFYISSFLLTAKQDTRLRYILVYGWLSHDQSNTHFLGSLPSLLYLNTTVKAITSCNLPVITSGS